MSAHASGWSSLPVAVSPTTFVSVTHVTEPTGIADKIPAWAVIAVFAGCVIAAGGFVAAWFTASGFAPLSLACGLFLAAVGMRAAERAIEVPPMWQPLSNE